MCQNQKKNGSFFASPETSYSLLLKVYHNSRKDNVLGPVVQIIVTIAKASHIFSTKNIGIFEILMFEIF